LWKLVSLSALLVSAPDSTDRLPKQDSTQLPLSEEADQVGDPSEELVNAAIVIYYYRIYFLKG